MNHRRSYIERQDAEWQRTARRYLFRLRSPVLFEETAVRALCRLAREGYEANFKKETYGLLFGRLDRGGRLTVRRSCYYRGGTKTRTGVIFKDWATIARLARRRRELAREMRLRFAGSSIHTSGSSGAFSPGATIVPAAMPNATVVSDGKPSGLAARGSSSCAGSQPVSRIPDSVL